MDLSDLYLIAFGDLLAVGGGSVCFVPRNETGLDAKIAAYPAEGWSFKEWSVTKVGGDWDGDIGLLYSDSVEDGVHHLRVSGSNVHAEHNYYVTLQVTGVFEYAGSGQEPSVGHVVVSVVSSGDGSGTTFGGGTYAVGASYTVGGTPSASPRSAVTRITSTTGVDVSYRNDLSAIATRSQTATATANVTWTVEFRRVFVVSAHHVPIAGGASTVPLLWNCAPSVTGSFGTTTVPVGTGGSKTGYMFVAGDTCTIDANPGSSDGYYAHVLRFRTDAGGNWDGQVRGSFAVAGDVEYAIMCAYDQCVARAEVYTDMVPDSSGGSCSLSKTRDVAAGDQITVTATPTASSVRADGTGEDSWAAGKSAADGTVLETYTTPDRDGHGTSASSPVTITVSGKNARGIYGSGNAPAWLGLESASGAGAYFSKTDYLAAEAFFRYTGRDYEFEIRFAFRTYASHGAAYLDDERITSGQRFKISRTETRTLALGALTQWPYADPDWFCYGIVQVLRNSRSVMYSYPSAGGAQVNGLTIQFPPYAQVDGATYTFDVWVWPVTTGKILCSPDNGGAILCGSGGAPMAQYID